MLVATEEENLILLGDPQERQWEGDSVDDVDWAVAFCFDRVDIYHATLDTVEDHMYHPLRRYS